MPAHPASSDTIPQRTSAVLRVGTLLDDRFIVGRMIAAGGQSSVYQGWDGHSGQKVAIKRLVLRGYPEDPTCSEALQAFRREANLLRGLRHPQLPRQLAAFDDPLGSYIVMEYIDGMTLDQLIERGAVDQEVALAIADELYEIVAYLHDQTPAIIHADLKPSNIMLVRDGRVVLLDLGLARPREPAMHTRDPMGTIPFTPPEQWRGEPLDTRSDIYALAVMLGDLLECMADVPAVKQVLARATAQQRSARYPTVAALRCAMYCAVAKPCPRHEMLLGHSMYERVFRILVAVLALADALLLWFRWMS